MTDSKREEIVNFMIEEILAIEKKELKLLRRRPDVQVEDEIINIFEGEYKNNED